MAAWKSSAKGSPSPQQGDMYNVGAVAPLHHLHVGRHWRLRRLGEPGGSSGTAGRTGRTGDPGADGAAAGFGTPTATVDNNTGFPL